MEGETPFTVVMMVFASHVEPTRMHYRPRSKNDLVQRMEESARAAKLAPRCYACDAPLAGRCKLTFNVMYPDGKHASSAVMCIAAQCESQTCRHAVMRKLHVAFGVWLRKRDGPVRCPWCYSPEKCEGVCGLHVCRECKRVSYTRYTHRCSMCLTQTHFCGDACLSKHRTACLEDVD